MLKQVASESDQLTLNTWSNFLQTTSPDFIMKVYQFGDTPLFQLSEAALAQLKKCNRI